MCFARTSILGIRPCFQLIGAQRPISFGNSTFAMDPLRFDGVQPGAFRRQPTGADPHALPRLFDGPMMGAEPPPHGLARVPGGGVPVSNRPVMPWAAQRSLHHAKQAMVTALTGRPSPQRSSSWAACCGRQRTNSPYHARAVGSRSSIGRSQACSRVCASSTVQRC